MSVKKINIKKLSGALCGVVLSAAVALTACSGGGAYKQGTPSFVESSSTVSASVSDASAAKGDTGAVNKNKNTESRSVGANASGVSSASVGTALKKPGGGSYFNGKGGRKPGKNADRKGHITLRVWDSNANTALARAAKDYEKIHPNVTIMVDNVSNPSPDSVKYAVSNETAADIIYIDQVYNASLGKEGYFADLTYFGANKVKDKFMASTVKSLSVGGALYGLPFDANTICFYYNKDIFKAAGAKPPTPRRN